MEKDRVLTVEDVAAYLRLSIGTVREMFRKGQLPGSFKLGREWRILEQDLRAHIEHLKKSTAGTAT